MHIPEILKNKWVLIGGGGLILIVLFMSASGSSGSSASTANGPTDAQVAAQTQLALAQLSAQSQQNTDNAGIAQIQAQSNADIAKASLDAQLQQYAIDANAALQTLQINTSRDVALAGNASDAQSQAAATAAQEQITKWTLDASQAMQDSNNAFQLDYATAANTTAIQIQQMQASLVNNQLLVNRDVTLAGLQSQTDQATIYANLQENVTYSNNSTQQAIIASTMNAQTEQTRIMATNQTEQERIMADVQKKQSSNGLFGSIIGGVLGLFSDPRLKKNIVRVGSRPDGLDIYAYEYVWGGKRHLGVMADEVEVLRPEAMGASLLGFRTVHYDRLNA